MPINTTTPKVLGYQVPVPVVLLPLSVEELLAADTLV